MGVRPYDTISGLKFQIGHPLWPKVKKGKNKGKPSSKLLPVHIKALGEQVNLVPNLTHITGVLSSFGSFSAGAEWGCKMAVESCYEQCRGRLITPDIDTLRRAVREEMDKPTERGSEMHDEIEQHLQGMVIQNNRLADTVDAILATTRASVTGRFQTEAQYISDTFGFTLDFVDHSARVIIDWKTVCDAKWYRQEHGKGGTRKPKPSEALQLAAIQKTIEGKYHQKYRVFNAYIGRESSKLVALIEWPQDLCELMQYEVMPLAIKLYTLSVECRDRVKLVNKMNK